MIRIHTVAAYTTIGAFERMWPDDPTLGYEVAVGALVAEAFKQYTGESLMAGAETRAFRPDFETSPPATLLISITAYWNRYRDGRRIAIEREIQRVVRTWDPELAGAMVKLNIFGEWDQARFNENVLAMPVYYLINGRDPVSGEFRLDHKKIPRLLSEADIFFVGELVSLTYDELRQRVPRLSACKITTIYNKLREIGLTLSSDESPRDSAKQLVPGDPPAIPGPEPY